MINAGQLFDPSEPYRVRSFPGPQGLSPDCLRNENLHTASVMVRDMQPGVAGECIPIRLMEIEKERESSTVLMPKGNSDAYKHQGVEKY